MVVSLESGCNPLLPQDVVEIGQQLGPLCLDQIEDTALRDLLITANGAIPIDMTWPVAQKKVAELIRGIPNFEPRMSNDGLFGILNSGVVGFVANKAGNEKRYNRENILALVAYLDTKKTLPSDAGPGPSRRKVRESTIGRLGVGHPLAQLLMDKDEDRQGGGLGFTGEQKYAEEVTKADLENWLAQLCRLNPLEELNTTRLSLGKFPSSPLVVPVIVGMIRKIAIGAPSRVADVNFITNGQFKKYLEVCLSHFNTHPEITTFAQLCQICQMVEKTLRT